MAFAQLTYRESLRDIEACLSAVPDQLYHMGIRGPVTRSTLADANEKRDWRIYADFAQVLISEARRLYAGEALDLELGQTVYALDSSTIELCIGLFPWSRYQQHAGRRQAPHPARSERKHPRLRLHHFGQLSRPQHPG